MKQELYEKHKKQINGLVLIVSRKWGGLEKEELPSEAYLYFCKALDTHDKQKGGFGTHLHYTVFGNLMSVCKSEYRKQIKNINLDKLYEPKSEHTNFCRALEEREILSALSPDASELLSNLLNSTIEPATEKRSISLERVYKVFGRQAGWTFNRLSRAWAELGRAYAAMSA